MNGFNDTSYVLIAILGLVVATLLTRLPFTLLPDHVQLPSVVEQALRYAPACALVAIIAPAVLAPGGVAQWSLQNDRLWAVVIGAAVFARTRSMVAMMAIGLGAFTVLRLWV